MNNDSEQHEPGATAGKFHTVQPLRDLESNWAVDLAKNLEEYLLKICSGEITSSADHDVLHLSVNFAEAALLLQGSVQVYSRKVEYLYSLVLHALEFISQKSSQEQETSASVESEENVSHPHDEEDDSFWGLDDIPADAKNVLDSANVKDAAVNLFVRPPANIVVLEGDCLDAIGVRGELESYLLATNDLFRDFILLDSCDAAAVNDFLNSQNWAGKVQNSAFRGSSVISKSQKSFQSPIRHSRGTGHDLSAKKKQDTDVNQSTEVNHDLGSNNCNIDSSPRAYDFSDNDDHEFNMENGYSEFGDSDDSDGEDPWKPLNPHEPGNLKVKPYKRVKAKMQGVNLKKRYPIMTEFPLAKPDALTEIWEEKLCASQRKGESQSPSLYEKLRQSLVQGENREHNAFQNSKDDGDNGYDSEDPDNEPPGFDMPENTYMYEDVPQHDKPDGVNIQFDTGQVYEDSHTNATLEDLCRSHLDSLLASLAETEKQTELAARVSTWKQRIEQNLEEQDSHPSFDIHEYGERVLNKLHTDGDAKNSMSFADVVKGQEKLHVARTFSSLLQLVNNGDVELERSAINGEPICYTAENSFGVHLLGNKKLRDEVPPQSSKKRAKSPKGCNEGKRNKSGKENRPAANGSKVSTSTCGFSVKLGKPGGLRCTSPEGKKRRKSRFLEPVNLHSPG